MLWLPGIRQGTAGLLALVMLVACAPSGPGGGSSAGSKPPPDANRALSVVTHVEPTALITHSAGPTNTGSGPSQAIRLFNANLAVADTHQDVYPVLQDGLPQLNTGAWKVLPDGTMEVTHVLRAGLTWHDGVPLKAGDWVFSWRLAQPFLPWKYVSDVVAVDDRTLLVRWDSPQAEADRGPGNPLPAHILEPRVIPGQPEAIANLAFWTNEYVGLGPYRINKWEPGAFIDALAFPGYALGVPNIGRVRVEWIGDPNTVVAAVLSGRAQLTLDQSLLFEQGLVLKEQWKQGRAVFYSGDPRYVGIMNDPQYAGGPELLDPRVRKALASGVNKAALNDALLAGEGTPVDALIPPWVHFYQALDQVIAKYPYDTRRSAQLLGEAGLAKGADGLYRTAAGVKWAPELRAQAGGQTEREGLILIDGWRSLGVDASVRLTSEAENNDRVFRSTYPHMSSMWGIGSNAREMGAMTHFYGPNNAEAVSRFAGVARVGWVNANFDRLYDQAILTLEPSTRANAIVEAMKLFTDILPGIPLYYGASVIAIASDLAVPDLHNIAANNVWNAHELRWRS